MPTVAAVLACLGLVGIIVGVIALRGNWTQCKSGEGPANWHLWLGLSLLAGLLMGAASWPLTFWMGYPVWNELKPGRMAGLPFFVAYFDSEGREYFGPLTTPCIIANIAFWFFVPQIALRLFMRGRAVSRTPIWLKHVGWALISLSIVAVIAFASVNFVDYLHFRRAWHIGDRLSPDDLSQIAAACAEVEKGGHQGLTANKVPASLRRLDFLEGNFYPGSSDLLLYKSGEFYVYMRISTSKLDQQIEVFTNFLVPQGQAVLWHKNPEYAKRHNPADRLLTISEYFWPDGGGNDWIVLPEEIRVIDRHPYVGGDDAVVATIPLSEPNRRQITDAIMAIPASIRGRKYTSGGVDGIELKVSFAADGQRQSGDIQFSNTWREELGPLLDAVATSLPAKDAIGFKAKIMRDLARFDRPNEKLQYSNTWAEVDTPDKRWIWAQLPWWCVWPRLLNR